MEHSAQIISVRRAAAVTLLAIVALCGCIHSNAPASLANKIAIGDVAIISLLGDDFHLIHVGTTRFEYKSYVDSVPTWKIDDFITDLLKAELTRSGTNRVGVLGNSEVTFPGTRNELDFNLFRETATQKGFDTAIIIRPTSNPRAAHMVGGYGLLHGRRYPTPGLERCVFSAIIIELIDIESMDIVAKESIQNCTADIDVGFYPRLADYPKAEESLIHQTLNDDLARSILAVLGRLIHSTTGTDPTQ